MAKVSFDLREYADRPDELVISIDGKSRTASKQDTKDYPAEYKAMKMHLATQQTRKSWDEKRDELERAKLKAELRKEIEAENQ